MAGLPYGDIIVIGAIAAFILLRYRAMLGEKSGRDEGDVTPIRPLQEYERVIQLPEREPVDVTPDEPAPLGDHGALTERYAAMRAIDRQFAPDVFLDGARTAFEMVLQAFNEADRETLAMLLSKDICREFERSLDALAAKGHTQQTTLLAILDATIADAALTGTRARLTVDFTSEQVHLVRDKSGGIVEGDPATQEAVEDRWVFERNLASNDPAWKVVET